MPEAEPPPPAAPEADSLQHLLRELRTSREGLSVREAARRLVVVGPNALPPQPGPQFLRALFGQLVHPLALLLWMAAGLSFGIGNPALGVAVVAVVLLNAVFALAQQHQAERAVEALSAYVPLQATVVRDGTSQVVAATTLVPGDVLVVEEGERISADARLLLGAVEVDLSPVTGESLPVLRTAARRGEPVGLLQASDVVLSGTLCTAGSAHAVVFATGARAEIGRIAALSSRQPRAPSPLEHQVKGVARLIAMVALAIGGCFLPLGLLAGLPLHDASLFAIGLLVANVPEGLLPTITLALAVGARSLARSGAVVKRLSAVETLGSTTVICTDKTGTLTQNAMVGTAWWTGATGRVGGGPGPEALQRLATSAARCSSVEVTSDDVLLGDPTEVAVHEFARAVGLQDAVLLDPENREQTFRFDPGRRLMSVVGRDGAAHTVLVKGAPEAVLARCVEVADGTPAMAHSAVDELTREGLRVLAIASRHVNRPPDDRDDAERDLTLLGLVALYDPPRPEVAAAVGLCHGAGIRVHVVTGDHPRTAEHLSRTVGIGLGGLQVVDGPALDAMTETQLDQLLARDGEIVFARSSPEAKLRIADALRAAGQVVAMTGDGVNDAPALHRADIGVAMGRSGTDVAREAATLVLTDDNFATIPLAVEAGRRVFDNVRKFVLYIFAHAVPEVVPFLVFALGGGAIPLPLTVLQILAIDLGTETLPALALGREPAEPGLMLRPPRPRDDHLVQRSMLVRAWLELGLVSAALVMGAFFWVLWRAGWHPGDPVGAGTPLHHAYLQATTATFLGIVSCQVGTAFAARTEHVALRDIGLLSNPLLLWGIAFELLFAAGVVYLPSLQAVFNTAALPASVLLLVAPFPFVVWGVDEARRAHRRRRQR